MTTINNNKNFEVSKDYVKNGDSCIWYRLESENTSKFKYLFLNSENLNEEYILREICKKENIGFIDKYELEGCISKDCQLIVKKK